MVPCHLVWFIGWMPPGFHLAWLLLYLPTFWLPGHSGCNSSLYVLWLWSAPTSLEAHNDHLWLSAILTLTFISFLLLWYCEASLSFCTSMLAGAFKRGRDDKRKKKPGVFLRDLTTHCPKSHSDSVTSPLSMPGDGYAAFICTGFSAAPLVFWKSAYDYTLLCSCEPLSYCSSRVLHSTHWFWSVSFCSSISRSHSLRQLRR